MKVMVVEDDPVSLELIQTILKENDYEVVTAESGGEAITMLKAEEPVDIIVSDIMMPVMSGFQLVTYLNADAQFKKIPVILCSALNDIESVKKGLNLGAVDYIVKPVDATILLDKVRKASKKVPGSVLVVDDEELLRGLLQRILTRYGIKVLLADSGKQALEMMKTNKITAVLSDIAMPAMDGFELLAYVKEFDMSIPVLLMSGRSEYNRNDVVTAGAEDFITKPFNNVEILDRIRPFMR